MKVAFLASEAVPFAKTGGLADVAGSLPAYLARLGADVRLVMPFYREVRKKGLPLRKILDGHGMAFGPDRVSFSVWKSTAGGFPAYFIENDSYFDRDYLYGLPSGDYPDNGERFGFFSKAALETLQAVGFPPRVLHCHDWQSALALAFLKHVYNGEAFFQGTRSLFTIHNLAYQGLFEKEILGRIGLPDSLFNMNNLEFWGEVNFLKAGILYSTALNTVSPRYSREIQTPEFGCGLDGLLRTRASALYGLLNGVDYTAWNPESDPLIPSGFTAADLSGKTACREELLNVFGLEAGPETAVIGIVSRLAGQKGLDIVHEALPALFDLDLRLVILGTGETKIQDDLRAAARAHPSKLGLKIAFDEKIAHTVYAGSDAFLIPSKYEPCGLTQMYSLRYGAIPIVRATGGLDDSVREYDPSSGSGNGFKFERETPEALVGAVRNALSVFGRPGPWRALVRNAMAEDFSWEKAAGQYLELYEKISSR